MKKMSMAFLQQKNVLGLNQLNGQMTHSLGDQHCGETVMEKSHGDCGLKDANPEIVDTELFPPKNGLISEVSNNELRQKKISLKKKAYSV